MKRCLGTLLVSSLALIVNAIARDTVLPAGTLLQCTVNEPNFSTNSVSVGDPVLCHLRGMMGFGPQAFPRESYLVGHLEAAKDPGRFVGKGYLELHFDRIGVPSGDVPVDAKIVEASKYKVDRAGKIHGKGHARRDAAEWMLPPLWPMDVVLLPARGPRPRLKDTVLTLRLMDDVAMPQITQTISTGGHFFGLPEAESYQVIPGTEERPASSMQFPAQKGTAVPQVASRYDNPQAAMATTAPPPGLSTPTSLKTAQSLLILRSGATYMTTSIRMHDNRVSYTLSDGTSGVVNVDDIDWTKSIRMNAENGAVLALSASSH